MRNRRKQRMAKRGEHVHQQGTERTISYYNGEGYADPTAFAAVKNIVKRQRTYPKNKT